ncbi:damage-control phosphatase ARMT1 [Scaptodrosophila lebanonensis]|uniref:Sugar phosphate phosphatase n=1 Tax=Drosophila lebanonensis TaxID=7225 RepID=A0A6J2UBR9_DROLE|nr:damage-control phosphatase ARMT1 [Scaptodrosophila lebanonensis]
MFMEFRRSSLSADQSMPGMSTPRHSLLSGRFKQSFAYLTLRTRMPGIMQQIISHMQNNTPELVDEFGEDVRKDITSIVDAIERLKVDLNRDRYFTLFHGDEPDQAKWNAFLSELPKPKRSYFRACWLHAECYLYRRIFSFFEHSQYLKTYDYFAHLKQEDLKISVPSMKVLATATRQLQKDWTTFNKLMRLSLWSNHFEIQMNAILFEGPKNEKIDVLSLLIDLDHRILANESMLVWNCLIKAKKRAQKRIIVDYVCDNAGFELFTDLIFIEYLVDTGLATQVRMHVKAIPWYISDATRQDIEWTLDFLQHHPSDILSSLGHKFAELFRSKLVIIAPQTYFWTGPQPFFVMVDVDIELFKLLAGAELAIFKGDLNYRKLMGDYIWDPTEEFITCLRGFRPTNVCAMRTVKCEVICGLPEGVADSLVLSNPQWMTSGYYAVIQYTDSLRCNCCLLDQSEQDGIACDREKTVSCSIYQHSRPVR